MTTARVLDADVTNTSGLLSINVSESHSSSTAVASITAVDSNLDVGDSVTVRLGYVGNKPKVFEGYVKKVERKYPDGLYTITANDAMIRAIDYFIVGPDPESPFKYRNISAESLVAEVLQMAGLNTIEVPAPTSFTFGINNDVEVNLVSSYDYAKMISDLLAWEIWCDHNSVVHFANRKPFVMTGDYDGGGTQPGWIDDPTTGIPIIDDMDALEVSVQLNEKDLRNKIVVYGKDTLSASAQQATSYDALTSSYRQVLPAGFYKAAVLASPLIEDKGFAQKACNYNLHYYNRLGYEIPVTLEGSPSIHARSVLRVDSDVANLNSVWYVFQLEHSWGKGGYTTSMVLRK